MNEATHHETEDQSTAPVTPETIARLSQTALATCQQASGQLRELGAATRAFGNQIGDHCDELAGYFDRSGESIHQQVLDYSTRMLAAGQEVRRIADSMPRAGGSQVRNGRGAG